MYPAADLSVPLILREYQCEDAPADLSLDDARAILTLHGTHRPLCPAYLCALNRAASVLH